MTPEAPNPEGGAAAEQKPLWRIALKQSVALMLLASLPAFASWRWQSRKVAVAPPMFQPSASAGKAPSPAAMSSDDMLGLDQAIAHGDQVLWIDARRSDEFARAHVPGALPLNEENWDTLFPAVLQRWNPQRQVVVYCDGGGCQASRQIAARLRDAGITDAVALRGGWPAWVERFGQPKP